MDEKLNMSLNEYASGSAPALTINATSAIAPALAINATIAKTKRRFKNGGKFGLLCGTDSLSRLIVSGDQRHWGEFITSGGLACSSSTSSAGSAGSAGANSSPSEAKRSPNSSTKISSTMTWTLATTKSISRPTPCPLVCGVCVSVKSVLITRS